MGLTSKHVQTECKKKSSKWFFVIVERFYTLKHILLEETQGMLHARE